MLNKFIFTILISFTFLVNSFSQTPKIDSLKHLLSTAQADSAKFKILISLSYSYNSIDRIQAMVFAKQALTQAKKLNNQYKIGEALNWLGELNWFSGDYSSASQYYFQALKIYEAIDDKLEIGNSYRNIGWIYMGEEDYKQALIYYEKALKINEELGEKRRVMMNLDDFGILYKYMGENSKALEYAKKTIVIAKEINDESAIGSTNANLAYIYINLKQYEKGINHFKISIDILRKHKSNYNLSSSLVGLSTCYLYLKQLDSALVAANEAFTISKKNDFKFITISASDKLSKIYFEQNNYEKAYHFLEIYASYNDSIYEHNNKKQIKELAAKYEFDKKELLINSLENEKQKEKEFRYYLIGVCILIIVFAVILYRGNIQKKKANNDLSLAYKQIEEKNNNITDSINYSKRIQEAMLPPVNKIQNLFSSSFILYKPKDIVSGDFYWFAEEDEKKLIAACDCTGHGVPGALMSMIGNNFLNQIVKEKIITSPDEILYDLNKNISNSLNQNENNDTQDGMDIALITINSENELEFAGAQRPLWITRYANGSYTLEEIKGTKKSIGGNIDENKRFEKLSFPLYKGDNIYLFSDGYADQFGGVEGKKLMTKKFKNLILSICSKPSDEQKIAIENYFDEWKGNREQVDDVLVIGIKI